MAVKVKTKKLVVGVTVTLILLILCGLAFVSYFMHAVYEVEEEAVRPSDVPAAVRTAFIEKFPHASDEAWELDDGIYDVEFESAEGRELEAEFKADGTWLLTEGEINFADLPMKAQAFLEGKEGYKIKEIERIAKADGKVVFEAELMGTLRAWEYEFDADGNVISRDREGPILEGAPD